MSAACDHFWESLEEGPSSALHAHARGCAECRAVLEALTDTASSPVTQAPLAEEARAELAARPQVRSWWWGASGLGLVWFALLLAVVRPWTGRVLTPGFGRLGLPLALGLVAAFGAAWIAALSPRRGRAALIGIVGMGVAVTAMLSTCVLGTSGWFHGTAHCALTCVLTAALPLIVAVVLLRRFSFSWPRAVAGIGAAGGVGVLMLELVCPSPSFAHVALSHVLPWVVVCAAAVAVRRALRSTSFAP